MLVCSITFYALPGRHDEAVNTRLLFNYAEFGVIKIRVVYFLCLDSYRHEPHCSIKLSGQGQSYPNISILEARTETERATKD